MSNVGFPSRYEPQSQQRSHRQSEVDELTRHSGANLKGYLPKDQANEVNRLQEQEIQRRQDDLMKKDPTFAAMRNGNKPSAGALIDKEIQEEEQAMLRRKSDAMARRKSESYY